MPCEWRLCLKSMQYPIHVSWSVFAAGGTITAPVSSTYHSNGGTVPVEEIRDTIAQDRSSHTGGKVGRCGVHVSQQECLIW